MDEMEMKKELANRMNISRILWGAMFGSVCIYLALGYALPRMGGFKLPPYPPPDVVAYALIAVGAASAGTGVLIALGALPFPKISQGEPPAAVIQKVFSFMIVSWALCETAALLGLALFFLGGSFNYLFTLSIIAVGGLAIAFPKEEKYTEALKKAGA